MTAVTLVGQQRFAFDRQRVIATIFVMLGLVDIFVFGLYSNGDSVFTFTLTGAAVSVPNLVMAAAPVCYGLGALSVVFGLVYAGAKLNKLSQRLVAGTVTLAFVLAFLVWSDAGRFPLPFVSLMQSTMLASIPLVLGALSGCLCERSGVINIAIEGQLLLGAFAGAVIASAFGSLWFGLLTGSVAGGLLAILLGVFAIRYMVDQIILGVVLNVFASGLTGYLYDQALVPYQNRLNSPATFSPVKIPLLGDIPIIGPIFFDSTIFLYITYAAVALVHIGLFKTRYGLRVRAVGEQRDHRRPHCRHRRGVAQHRVGRLVRKGHVLRTGLHRPGGDDLRPLDPARGDRRRFAVRLLGCLRQRARHHRLPHPIRLLADAPLRGDDHRRGWIRWQEPGTEGGWPALRKVLSRRFP
jgi:ABC-type uncharacterized transport system permease subunit